MKNKRKKTKAQSVVEYTILVAVAAAAFLGMRVYLQRAVSGSMQELRKHGIVTSVKLADN